MKKISAIGFDWGGVVLQKIDRSFADVAAQFLKIDSQRFRRAYFLHNHMTNIGANSRAFDQATEMWRSVLSELDLVDRLDAFMAFVQSRPRGEISQTVVALLQHLKQRGWKLGLLSNMSAENLRQIRSETCLSLFDATLFSAEIGCMKPEPEAFFKLAKALDVPIEELAFIDDSERSLSTAAEVGYTPLLFHSTEQLVADLKTLGIE